MYNVLWIDDQHDDPEMLDFLVAAENEGLLLFGFPSFEEGFEALEKRIMDFDGILLDGLFFERKGQVIGTEDETGIGMAIAKINELKSKKVFPWFVLSGKDKFTQGENALLKANKAKCYDKTNPADVENLFAEMKLELGQQHATQLKHKYAALLEVCTDEFLGSDHYLRLFSLLEHIESEMTVKGGEDILTAMRKIVEAIFHKLSQYQIIPSQIIGSPGWINGSSLFLAGKHSEYIREAEIVPPMIALNIERLLEVIQDGSHANGALKYRVDEYMRTAQSDYLFRGSVYLLFDLLLWFKAFIESNSDVDINRARWKSKLTHGEWVPGNVTRIAENGWGTFQPDLARATISIHPKLISEHSLSLNDRIKVITEPSPDGTKTHIKEIGRI